MVAVMVGATYIHTLISKHTHTHSSKGQAPITLACQPPQLSMINPFSMAGQQHCTDKT